MAVSGTREDLEKDFPKVFSAVHGQDDGSATGYERAFASYEDLYKARINPHDLALNRIIERQFSEEEAQQELISQQDRGQEQLQRDVADWKDSLRREAARTIAIGDAWLQVRAAIKVLFRVLPCGLLGWHSKSVSQDRDGKSVMVCARCRAWRTL